MLKMDPEVVRTNLVDMQVCVPEDWDDDEVKTFADRENPVCVPAGWDIRKEGSKFLGGDPERNPCQRREGFVHITLDV